LQKLTKLKSQENNVLMQLLRLW